MKFDYFSKQLAFFFFSLLTISLHTQGGQQGINPSTFSWDQVSFDKAWHASQTIDIRGWPETSRITKAEITRRGVCLEHTKLNEWHHVIRPGWSKNPGWNYQGDQWLIYSYNEQLYVTGYEHMHSYKHRQGATTCQLAWSSKVIKDIIDNLVNRAQNGREVSWYPQPGEVIGFFVSTGGFTTGPQDIVPPGRFIQERSNVAWIKLSDFHNNNTSGGEWIGSSNEVVGGGGSGPITRPPEIETPGNGMCGDKVNTCTSGVFHGHPPDTATEHRWICRSIPHSAGETQCHKSRLEDNGDENLGRCGGAANTCSGGDSHDHPPDTEGEIIWSCRNRDVTFTMDNGQEMHSGEIRCAVSTSGGEVRAVDWSYDGGGGD